VAGSLLAAALILAFWRVHTMNRRLHEANQEFALAARTNAVGAVMSHLIHGLKNPLASLQLFVEENQARGGEADWQDAAASARRMQSLIHEVLGILRDQGGEVYYEIVLTELRDLMRARMSPAARAAGVSFEVELEADAALSNRDASLIGLILETLIENAIEATPKGKSVRLEIRQTRAALEFAVVDQGAGLAPQLLEDVFKPCPSTKPGGAGIGLAICRQLAAQIGARLELKSSTPRGCVFCLSVAREKKDRAVKIVQTVAA
jgi:signal transduction histidine kinase